MSAEDGETTDLVKRVTVLRLYYENRRSGYICLHPSTIDAAKKLPMVPSEIDRISVQLVELGHLRNRRLDRLLDREENAEYRLTAAGIDAVEGQQPAEETEEPPAFDAPLRWFNKWQTVLLALLACGIFVKVCRVLGAFFNGEVIDWPQNFELFGNGLILLGVVATAIGSRLSKNDFAYLTWLEESKKALLDNRRISRILKDASHYSLVGLIYLSVGTTIVIVTISSREPEQESHKDKGQTANEEKQRPVLFEDLNYFGPSFLLHELPTCECSEDSKSKSPKQVKRHGPNNDSRKTKQPG